MPTKLVYGFRRIAFSMIWVQRDYRERFLYVAQALAKHGSAYLHNMDGLKFGFHGLGEAMTLAEFKQVYPGCIIGNTGYTKALAEQRLQVGNADLIAFGRPFISSHGLVSRFQQNLELNPYAEMDLWYTNTGANGYTDFPMAAVVA